MITTFKNILYQIELTLLNLKIPEKPTIIRKSAKSILEFHMPNSYLKIGLKTYQKDLKKSFIMVLLIIITLISMNIFFPSINVNLIDQLIIVQLFLLYIPFALPSTYAFDNIDDIHIFKIINILQKNKINNIERIEHFELYLEKAKLRVHERINAIKWLVSAFWILVTFLFSQYLTTISSHIDKISLLEFSKVNFDIFGSFLILLIITIIFIACYKRGMAFIFNSIELALIEFKHQLKHH